VNKVLEGQMLNNLFALVFGGPATNNHLSLGLFGVIFTGYGVEVKLIANGGFASPHGPGNSPDAVAFVAQYLDLITFILSELSKSFFIA
jgi:hypothetical protein